MQTSNEKICAVTGTGGYLGSRVKDALEKRDWQVVELTRSPKPGARAKKFVLGDDVSPEIFARAKALVHCAYDFKQLSWGDIERVNVFGSEKVLRAARQADIENIICISSISAFEGCRSLYGKAKLQIEKIAHSLGAVVIRPGLIYGDSADGMFGKLVSEVDKARILPLFGSGSQIQYLIHEDDLTAFICDCARGKEPPPARPITVANDQPWSFRQILEAIAAAKRKKLSFIPVPWRLVWTGIKSAEFCHVPLNFRSDSLVSLIYQNPNPSFAEQRQLKIACRPFSFKAP
jgi:nucleoside-diphosphate-sugar epimerase